MNQFLELLPQQKHGWLIVTCFLFLIFVQNASGQNKVTDSTATIIGYWTKGDKMQYSFTQKKQKSNSGKVTSDNSSTSVIDLEVVGATDNTYTIHWKYSQVKLNTPVSNEFVVKMSKLTEGMVIKYSTDEFGAFKEILNLLEIQDFMMEVTGKISRQFPTAVENKAVEELRKNYSNKDFIEQIVLKDLQLFHNVYGGEYTLHQKIEAETELPNFLGGPPFPATLSIEMLALEPTKDYCKIIIKQEMDKEKTTKIMNEWMAKMSEGKSKPKVLPELTVNDSCEYEFDLKTGWVKKILYKRIVQSDDIKNIESYELQKM